MVQFIVDNWLWILLALLAVGLLTAFFMSKTVRVGIKTWAMIISLSISYKKNSGVVPKNVLVGEITFRCGDRNIAANLYRPADKKPHPALILAHGAIQGGKDDRALRFGGQGLATAGYVALVPQLEHLNRLRLHQDDVDALAAGVRYLSENKFCSGKIGLMGVCLSANLVFLATARPEVKKNVSVITCWGGFYNIHDWLQAVIAQRYIEGGRAVPWKPRELLINEAPKWLVELSPASDRACLQKLIAGNDSAAVREQLSERGRVMYELLSNHEPEKVKDLWAKLDPQVKRVLDSLSPHTKIEQYDTKIAIIHTFNDDVIPWVESPKLLQAVGQKNKIYYRIFRQFYHVSIEDLLKARISNLHRVVAEGAQFYMYMYSILYRLS